MATSTGKKLDLNQLAKRIVDQATGDAPKLTASRKSAARKGGLKGGVERMSKLDDAERKALSAKGVAARKKAPAVQAGALLVKK